MVQWLRTTLVASLLFAGCSSAPPPRQYELTGQILAVDAAKQEFLVKHDDINGFMPAMTMRYKVNDASEFQGKTPGDLIIATLVVEETAAHLSKVTRTGTAPIEPPDPGRDTTTFEILEPGEEVPDIALVDENGTPRPLSSYRGHRVALTFIYTRCPDAEFCPLMNQNFIAVQKALKSAPALGDVRLLSVTFDPDFDTPAVLKAQSQTLQADPAVWSFATGPKEELTTFASRFGVTATSDGGPLIIHNLGTAVIDPQGKLVTLHSTNRWTPTELVAELTAVPVPAR